MVYQIHLSLIVSEIFMVENWQFLYFWKYKLRCLHYIIKQVSECHRVCNVRIVSRVKRLDGSLYKSRLSHYPLEALVKKYHTKQVPNVARSNSTTV
jgi:hypothetical protein